MLFVVSSVLFVDGLFFILRLKVLLEWSGLLLDFYDDLSWLSHYDWDGLNLSYSFDLCDWHLNDSYWDGLLFFWRLFYYLLFGLWLFIEDFSDYSLLFSGGDLLFALVVSVELDEGSEILLELLVTSEVFQSVTDDGD